MISSMSTAPYVLGAIAGVAIVKTFFRPRRAVVKEGQVEACPGSPKDRPCDPSLAISTPQGSPVYSTVSGRVAAVGDKFVLVASGSEPVVVMVDGVVPEPLEEGQYVGRGQKIGESMGVVYFGVTEFLSGGGSVAVDPASWLASRGQRIAHKNTDPGSSWCEGGRHIEVPGSAGRGCDLHEPDKGGFALLPVTVSVDR
jgi:hypothetical protein